MILVTFRPEYKTPWAHDPIATQLPLNRLARSQVVAMVNALAGAKTLPDAVLEHIVVRTDGVPLFIEEMFEGLKESGLLVEEATSYRLTRGLDAQAVPATLQDSLMARLDRLAPAKAVAQIGAVIGRQFSYALLAAIAPPDETKLRRALRDLVGAGLVVVHGEPPEANYSFKHSLVQDAAYNSLLRTQRQTAHNRIGVTLEEARASDSTPELLAHHFEQAGEIGKALKYWEQAGDRAAASSAGREATVHYRAAVSLARASSDGNTRTAALVELLMKLGNALMQIEGFNSREAFDVYQEACAIARPMDDQYPYLRACLEIVPLFFGACRYKESLAVLGSIDESKIEGAGHIIRIRFGLMRAIAEYFLGHFESAWSALDRVRRLDDAEPCTHENPAFGADPAIIVRIYLSYASAIMGKLEGVERLADEALSIATTRGHDFTIACAQSLVATTRRGAHREISEASKALIDICQRNGFHSMLGYGLWLRGIVLLRSGQEREGIDEVRNGLAFWRQGSGMFGLTGFLTTIGNGLAHAGRLDLLDEFVREAEDIVERTDEKYAEADVTRLRARVVGGNDVRVAQALLERAIAIAHHQSAKLFELRAARDLALLLVAQGRHQEARAALQPVYDRFTEGLDAPDLTRAKALLDELAAA
jgi:tetratricopeptide (TPR) repeat protein